MNRIIKIIIIICVAFLLKDCLGLFYIKMTHLSESDLEWVRCDNAIFESNSGKSVRMTDMGKYIHNKTNPFHISSAGSEYEANAGYQYLIGINGYEINGYFAVRVSIANDSLEFNTQLGGLSTNGFIPLISEYQKINNQGFENCLVIDQYNAKHNKNVPLESDYSVSKFIINKKFGLIYFELDSGEKFYRKFKKQRKNIYNPSHGTY